MNVNTLLSIILGVNVALMGFALQQIYKINATLAVVQADVNDDKRIKNSISKFWKLHGWEKDEINDLRAKDGLPSVRWPNLGE